MANSTVQSTGRRIVIVTTSPLISNPRVVKECTALATAGYDVTVIRGPVLGSLYDQESALNKQLASLVRIVPIDWNIDPQLKLKSAIAQRVFRAIFLSTGQFAPQAYTRLYHAYSAALKRLKADLFIAHNLTALPVTVSAAKRQRVKVGFDAEDFHSGQFQDSEQTSYDYQITRAIESRYIPQCDYLTAASDGIAHAYSSILGVADPTVILNVFPLRETETRFTATQRQAERAGECRSIYWFSQTVGPDRGLETAVSALALLPEDIAIVLRGVWADGYRDQITSMAQDLNVALRLQYRPPAPPDQMIACAACHDIGLALETTRTVNRDICVTNKLFTFLAGATPSILSDTKGQRPFGNELRKSTRLVGQADPPALASAILELLNDHAAAQAEARQVTHTKYNWDLESRKLLDVVSSTLN